MRFYSSVCSAGIIFAVYLLVLYQGGTFVLPQTIAIIVVGGLFMWLLFSKQGLSQDDQVYWLYPWLVVTFLIIVQLIPYKSFDYSQSELFELKNRLSAMPDKTIHYWVLFTMYWLVAWMVSNLDKKRVIFLIVSIAGLLFFELIYGLIAYVGNHDKILGMFEIKYYFDRLKGTFINPNHFAAMVALCMPVVISVLYTKSVPTITKIRSSIRLALILVTLLLATLAIFLSYSRMGLFCFLVSMMVFFVFVFYRTQMKKRFSLLLIVIFLFFAVVLLVGLWYGIERTLLRFERVGEDVRFVVWGLAFEKFPKSYWFWGMGAGTLVDNYRLIAPIEFANKVVHQLHSDWLEFVLDFGIIGSLIIVSAFLFWFKKTRLKKYSIVHYGALCGILAIAIHSIADFPLQVPGVAIIFWTLVGIFMNKKLSGRGVINNRA